MSDMTSTPRGIPKAANRRMLSIQSGSEMSRSPKESPPTIKKKLCRLVARPSTAENNSCPLETARKSSRPKMADGRSSSILKKAPPGGGSPPCGSPAEVRRVQFQQHVTVFLMSDEGDVYFSERHALNENRNENYLPQSARYMSPGCCVTPKSGALGSYDDDEDDELGRVDFRFVDDPERGTIVKFVLPLGGDYKPDDIIVKANVSGSRIRLVASRPVAYPDRSVRIEQLTRRFNLPIKVDPYMVTARLDIRGNLTVEAPLLRVSRRPEVRTEYRSATLQDISNKTLHNLRR